MTTTTATQRLASRSAFAPPIDERTLPVPYVSTGHSRSTLCYSLRVSTEITQRELRNDSGDIMRRLDAGESFVVTRSGTPVGELSPFRRHRFISADTAIGIFHGAPPVDFDRLRADLDLVADQNPSPRA